MQRLLALLVLALGLAFPSAASAQWRRAESAHFTVYSDGSEADLREAVTTLEQFDALLRQLLQPPEPAVAPLKLDVYLLRDRGDLRMVAPDLPNAAAGLYTASKGQVAAFVVNNAQLRVANQNILLHEYAHHFMWQYFPEAYPAWFVEGFAEYVGSARFRGGAIVVGDGLELRVRTLRSSGWITVHQLLNPDQRTPGEQFYALSWLATHYIINTPERMQGFARYLEGFQAGADPVESFPTAFGISHEAFVHELSDYLNGGMQAFGFAPPAISSDLTITTLPASADDMLLRSQRMRRFVGNDSNGFANEVQHIAERYPNDLLAQRSWANAEMWRGRPVESRAILERVLADHPDDVHTLHLLGYSFISEANLGAAEAWTTTAAQGRRYFARAVRIDPHFVPSLMAYAETYSHEPGALPDGPLDVLIQAHLLWPQVSEIRLQTGLELMEASMFDQAIPILRPLAYAPHRSAMTEFAKRALEHAERGEQLPPPEQAQQAEPTN